MGHRIKSTLYIYILVYKVYFFSKRSMCERGSWASKIHLLFIVLFVRPKKNMIPWVLLKTHEHSSVLTTGGAFGGLSYDTIPTFKEFTVPVAQLTHETLMSGIGCGFKQWLSNIAGSAVLSSHERVIQ